MPSAVELRSRADRRLLTAGGRRPRGNAPLRVLSSRAGVALVLAHLTAPLASLAQEAGRIPRIGMLGPSATDPMVEAFKQGLHELGYVDGKTIRFEYGDVAACLAAIARWNWRKKRSRKRLAWPSCFTRRTTAVSSSKPRRPRRDLSGYGFRS